jgi:hypothetical protein
MDPRGMDNVNNFDAHTLGRIYIPPKLDSFAAINDYEAEPNSSVDLNA